MLVKSFHLLRHFTDIALAFQIDAFQRVQVAFFPLCKQIVILSGQDLRDRIGAEFSGEDCYVLCLFLFVYDFLPFGLKLFQRLHLCISRLVDLVDEVIVPAYFVIQRVDLVLYGLFMDLGFRIVQSFSGIPDRIGVSGVDHAFIGGINEFCLLVFGSCKVVLCFLEIECQFFFSGFLVQGFQFFL